GGNLHILAHALALMLGQDEYRLDAVGIFARLGGAHGDDLGHVDLHRSAVGTGELDQVRTADTRLQAAGDAADIGAGFGRQLSTLRHTAGTGIVGGEHLGKAVALVQPVQIGGARHDV